jgi:hypothetical protein
VYDAKLYFPTVAIVCDLHKRMLDRSEGWYGEKWECPECLLQGLPQQQNLKFHKPPKEKK